MSLRPILATYCILVLGVCGVFHSSGSRVNAPDQPRTKGLTVTGGRRTNIVILFPDQWRAQAFGFAGDPNVKTPNLDRLERESCNFLNSVAGIPVCCPTRASIMTGQRALTHGVFLNDVPLDPNANTLAKSLQQAGYDTAFIGKWHLNGDGRSAFIPRERRQGFEYWKVLECTHDYNSSFFFADNPEKQKWNGYDAIAQTRDAQQYIRDHAGKYKPFLLFLSWGPPHDPYNTAPERYRAMYDASKLSLRPNVPAETQAQARGWLAGYYTHCSALDDCVGDIRATLKDCGIDRDTILVFSSDHGDLLGSHGGKNKQQPYDESVRIPMLIHWPAGIGIKNRRLSAPINSEDIMPTLLGLTGVPIPTTVEGLDYSRYIRGGKDPSDGAAMISCVAPFGQWTRSMGGKEYRGVRTQRYTYVRDLNGPWLLFDYRKDPYQTENLIGKPYYSKLASEMDRKLKVKLAKAGDEFKHAEFYIKKWRYIIDATGTVPYSP